MSWDLFLVRTKGPLDPDNPWEAEEVPLGSRKVVLDAIRSVFPDLEQETSSEFLHADGDLSIEFRLMGRGPIDQVSLEVRGDGDPLTPLLRLAAANGWRLFDVSASDYINPKKPARSSGYGGYRKMLKQITAPKSAKAKPATSKSKSKKSKSNSKKPTKKK